MVEQLATMSMQRQKIIARNLANQFVKPLFQEIYTLVVENEEEDKVIEGCRKLHTGIAITMAGTSGRYSRAEAWLR